MSRELSTDVLIIGGGGAAGRAAIAAADAGAGTMMVLKKTLGTSGATAYKCCEMAGFNVPGCLDNGDSREKYLRDIMDAALGMAEPGLPDILANSAADRFEDLRRWGLQPAMEGGKPVVMKGCYSSIRRTYTIRGHGEPIMEALIGQIKKRPIKILENSMAVDLIVEDGRCCGAVILDEEDKLLVVYARAVILATGGGAQVFLNNLNPPDVSGDGYSLAYDSGAQLMNMEFMQAGIGFFHPIKSLFNTYLWEGIPHITNRFGENFLEKHLPEGISVLDVMSMHCKHFPFSTRDISKYLEIAIQKEIESGGGTDRLCVPVSFAHFTDDYINSLTESIDLKQMWPMVVEHFKENGVDILRDPLEITCVAQAVNGGIRTDKNAMSSIQGLFAAGETAAGPHGADRLGGNMMGTCQVFGEIAGRNAAEFALHAQSYRPPVDVENLKAVKLLHRNAETDNMVLQLQRTAQTKLFICRSEEKLLQMLETSSLILEKLENSPYTPDVRRKNLELYFRINTAGIMAKAALERRESRGSHYREDYPEMDNDKFGRPIVLSRALH